jgi:multicomponent Na+:H+ antiporter subunit E
VSRLLPPTLVLVVWLALWGEITWANLLSGVLVVALIGLVIRPVPREHVVNPLSMARLLVVFVWRLVTSSLIVVRTVLAPTPERLRSGVVRVHLAHRSQLVATVLADAISLTPGTLTLDARDGRVEDDEATSDGRPVLYVHVLGLADPEAIRDDIRGLERLVVAAITPLEDAAEDAGAGS